MRARDLAEPAPAVRLTDPVAAALALVVEGAPGVVVTDDEGALVTVLPASQVVGLAVPAYLKADPVLARTWDEAASDRFATTAQTRTVESALPKPLPRPLVVEPDDTAVEVALAMSSGHSPLVVVVENGALLGTITVRRLLAALLPD